MPLSRLEEKVASLELLVMSLKQSNDLMHRLLMQQMPPSVQSPPIPSTNLLPTPPPVAPPFPTPLPLPVQDDRNRWASTT